MRRHAPACESHQERKGRAHPIGGDVADGVLQAAQEVVLDELVELDQALVNVDGRVDDLQPHLVLYFLHPLRRHFQHPTQALHLTHSMIQDKPPLYCSVGMKSGN